MRKTILLAIFLAGFYTYPAYALPQDPSSETSSFKGIEVLGGYAFSKIHEKGSYNPMPLLVGFDFDMKPFFAQHGFRPHGMLVGIIEPFAAYASQPDASGEIGTNFLVKLGFASEYSKLQPYFKGGTGILWMSLHTIEQATQFNFNEYAGFGLDYWVKPNAALVLEYRYRHVSNAFIKEPNWGIGANEALAGFEFTF
jgi:hypothetical protein